MSSDYSHLEWLQMGVFLIGMPIAALLGSMIGLLGKWNQGRVITAAVVGLGCAALVAVVLFLTFFLVYWQTFTRQTSFLLEIFDNFFAPRMASLAMIATGAVSILAAIGMRGRGDEAGVRMTNVTVRQLLLLQLFPFIALACWVGARSFALESGGELLRAQRLWVQRGWEVSGDQGNGADGWMRDFSIGPVDWKQENIYLAEIVRRPTLKSLELRNLGAPDDLAFEEFSNAKQLEQVIIYYATGSDVDQRQVDGLGAARSLKFLVLGTTGKITGDLQPLAALPQLDTVVLSDCTAEPESLSRLAESKSLRRLYLTRLTRGNSPAPIRFPPNLETLILGSSPLMPRWGLKNLGEARRLHALHIRHQKLMTGEIKAIATCGELEQLEFEEAIEEADLEELSALAKLRVLTITEAGAQRSQEFRSKLENLAMLPSLVQLNCDHQLVIEPEEWSGARPLPEIEEREARQEKWKERVNERRKSLGLALIKIRFSLNVGPFVTGGGGGNSGSIAPEDP